MGMSLEGAVLWPGPLPAHPCSPQPYGSDCRLQRPGWLAGLGAAFQQGKASRDPVCWGLCALLPCLPRAPGLARAGTVLTVMPGLTLDAHLLGGTAFLTWRSQEAKPGPCCWGRLDPGDGSTWEHCRGSLGEGERGVETAPWVTPCGLLVPGPQSPHVHTARGGQEDGGLPGGGEGSVRCGVGHTETHRKVLRSPPA